MPKIIDPNEIRKCKSCEFKGKKMDFPFESRLCKDCKNKKARIKKAEKCNRLIIEPRYELAKLTLEEKILRSKQKQKINLAKRKEDLNYIKAVKERNNKRFKNDYKNNPLKYKELGRKWREKNKERSNELSNLRRKKLKYRVRDSIKKGVERAIVKSIIPKNTDIFAFLGYSHQQAIDHFNAFINKLCPICNKNIITDKYHLEHIKPISQTISFSDILEINQLSNLRLTCITCNLEKGASH